MKKIIFILSVIIVIILIYFFIKTNYKKQDIGNNKNIIEIEEYILNINSYKSKSEITIVSNKNVNYYEVEQDVKIPQYSKQITISPKDIAGLEIIYKDGVMEIKNTEYNLSKIYTEYPYIYNNDLFLTTFIEEYRNSEEKIIKEQQNGTIIMEYESKNGKYDNKKKLYINKSTLKPEKLEVLDINNVSKVDILYKEIELNI